MKDIQFYIQQPSWTILACILVGVGYAWWLYAAQSPWSKTVNRLLAVFRFLLVTALCFLLLDPMINRIANTFEKPIVVFGIDNSESIIADKGETWNQLKPAIEKAVEGMEAQGFQVQLKTFDGAVDSLSQVPFDHGESNIDKLIQSTLDEYQGLHLQNIVLISDGIFNKGVSPRFQQYEIPITAIGIGDTLPKKDVNLKLLKYNKLSFLGNEFPLVAEVQHHGFAGQQGSVSLVYEGRTLETKNIKFGADGRLMSVEFLTTAKKVGTQHYEVQIAVKEGEFSTENNLRHAYIDVVDERQKIVLFAASPHPDIKMLKSVIDKKDKYELTVNTLSSGKPLKEPDDPNLVIFHQLPKATVGGVPLIEKYRQREVPTLFFVGNQTRLDQFNTLNSCVAIRANQNQTDEVTAGFNPDFDRFTLELNDENLFTRVPPVQVPFGDFEPKGASEILLFQRLGSIQTTKPLMMMSELQGTKHGVIIGEDLWRWRLFEFLETENTADFDQVMSKFLQLLVSKNDKRKLRVRPTQESFTESQTPAFVVETYNAIYEKTYGNSVSLEVRDEEGNQESYTMVNAQGRAVYPIKPLKEGVYEYTARATFGGEDHVVTGAFVVSETKLESAKLQADFDLLREVAAKSGGRFFQAFQMNVFQQEITQWEARSLIHSREEESPLAHYWWILFFLAGLASLEWALRKAKGGY